MRSLLLLVALLLTDAPAWGVPFWGARESSPVDTLPSDLAPGQWIWGGDSKAMGPMAVVVTLTEQRAYVYRNGILVAVSTVSTGKPGHRTPTGVFTILQKDKDHRSSKYNSAPMPYQERLTWDGIALHAGGLPGYPESHGCVHLPSEFARRLFDATNMGMTVVIADEGVSTHVAHPRDISPIEPHTGAEVEIAPLASGEPFRWTPEKAVDGPVSMILSRTDERLLVFRNGEEIGRTRVVVHREPPVSGTRAYIVAEGYMDGDNPDVPGTRMPNWITIGLPGQQDSAGRALDAATVGRVSIPPEFAANVLPLLKPGVVLVVTDASLAASGPHELPDLQVLNADPPAI